MLIDKINNNWWWLFENIEERNDYFSKLAHMTDTLYIRDKNEIPKGCDPQLRANLEESIVARQRYNEFFGTLYRRTVEVNMIDGKGVGIRLEEEEVGSLLMALVTFSYGGSIHIMLGSAELVKQDARIKQLENKLNGGT